MNLAPRPSPADLLAQRLEQTFRRIAATRMAGVPVLNRALQVQAIGFAPLAPTADAAPALLGILLTPWFMNLLRVPPALAADLGARPGSVSVGASVNPPGWLAEGQSAERRIGAHQLTFVGASEATLGHYEQCSLFSPMFQFADQGAAVATAREVLRLLRAPQPQPPTAAVPALTGATA
ncbi:MAG: [NiFe]-hydrogenase assembly, chaperone, HybE [Pseudomonadota bacterium]|jgi:hypothetical protein